MLISAFKCNAKQFDGNEELARRCNQQQKGEIALEMVRQRVILAGMVSSGG